MSERNARTRGYTTHVARPSRQRLGNLVLDLVLNCTAYKWRFAL